MTKRIVRDDDFGGKITYRFPKRSYDRDDKSFSLYVTGMNEVHATAHEGSTYISWCFSADDLLYLRNWIDEMIEPAEAAIRNKYEESKVESPEKETIVEISIRNR